MKRTTRYTILVCLLGIGLFSTAGCRGKLGAHCQVSSDCASGLYCVLPVGGTPSSGGTCETADGPDLSSDMPLPDLSPNPDLENDNDDLAQTQVSDLAQSSPDL